MNRIWSSLRRQCDDEFAVRGLTSRPDWPVFAIRLDGEFQRLAELFWALYGSRPDFALQLVRLVEETFVAYERRDPTFRNRDDQMPPESGWFASSSQIGAVAYVDRFAGSLEGMIDRIPYLKELGVTFLHLMPFFRSPERHNDGGYAVSSYRDTNPALGSMEDLEALAHALAAAGIVLAADFVFNHTSDEHEWAKAARSGDLEYDDFYLVFPDRAEVDAFQNHLRDIFPEVRSGSFTWSEDMQAWVWTTFHSYQWDLNYGNPAVFCAMANEMLLLANRGISVLRLDAVAFIWKQSGTSCENLPEAHTIIKAFQSIARLACPSMLFLSEAIVHPDDIAAYIGLRECQLSYNPLLMAELWEASATREVRLLSLSLAKRHRLPAGCAWINYVRCHDDIGWTFADEDAAELGINGHDHRAFLNDFYMGTFPGSFSRGVSFQYNPANGDRRICGSAASLAGIERARLEGARLEGARLEGARLEGDSEDLDTAVQRVLLLYGIAFSVGGIPLLYMGDELGVTNDYSYESDPAESADSRWVHRPRWSDELATQRHDAKTVAGRLHSGMARMAKIRAANPVFGSQGLVVVDPGHHSVLAFHKQDTGKSLTVLGNFSDHAVRLDQQTVSLLLHGVRGINLLDGCLVMPDEDLPLEPCAMFWILS